MSEAIASFKNWKEKKKSHQGNQNNNENRKWMRELEQIQSVVAKYSEFDLSKAESFGDYPLSSKTKRGLKEAGYTKPTAIQQASFSAAIQGRDVVGAAKTGSGKTLAFLIPVLECLYRERWSSMAGPGALIISPTRELAYQTFEVLRKVGKFHGDFSAGLIIGGKDEQHEASRMSKTNILVCTPGRLLHHMDQTVHFDLDSLQVLVLDEADRILDMGFKAALNAIIENLPREKQTLLFSATQTKSVKALARLSLSDPVYVSVHDKSKSSTPSGLNQGYTVCKLQEKLNLLYSFVKTHLKTKTLVFLTSCKQVKFIYAAFCKLRPGVPTMMLHGKMNQMRRMQVYEEFCRKQFALLFCTDVAARGLDIPAINWVVQLDCPEDAETYIHRVGRTARYHGEGHALLFLLESEREGMLQQLKDLKVPIKNFDINTEKITNISSRLESFCAAELVLKERAKRCFVSYLRAVYLMKNKSVFSVQSLPLADYSASLGLAVTPKIRSLKRKRDDENKKPESRNVAELTEKSNVLDNDPKSFDVDEAGSEAAELFSVKRKNIFDSKESDSGDDSGDEQEAKSSKNLAKEKVTRVGVAKKLLKKNYKYNQKIVFDDEGDVAAAWPPVDPKSYAEILEEPEENLPGLDIERAKAEMEERDQIDRKEHKMKVKQRHQENRWKDKESRREQQAVKGGRSHKKKEDEAVAYLGAASDDDSDNDDDSGRISGDQGRSNADSDDEMPAKRSKMSQPDDKREGSFTRLMDDGHSLKDDEKLALYLLKR